MPSFRPNPIAIAAALSALVVSGCAGVGSGLASRRTTMGTLKADVARLESQNQQFRGRVAELEADKRRVSEQLAQEREANGELTARLDDARMLLARQGGTGEAVERQWPDDSIERITPPSGRTRSSTRRPPFAQIGGGRRPIPTPDDEDLPAPEETPDEPARSSDLFPEDRERSTRGERTLRWLPVATGLTEPSAKRR
jgi:hypothetical protein